MNTAEIREAEHALQNLGWTELFAYLCPGSILLLSGALWVQPHLAAVFGEEMPQNEFIFAILFLLLSYAVGLPVARIGEGAANRYLLARAARRAFRHSAPVYVWWLTLRWLCWMLVSWIPELPSTPYFVDQRIRLQEEIEDSGLPGLSIAVNPWANLAIYRALVAERLSHPATLLLREAESVHRRCLFALGVACAATLVALEALLRIVLQLFLPEETSTALFGCPSALSLTGLITLAVIAAAASWALRYVAGGFLGIEFLLTCSHPLNPQKDVGPRHPSQPVRWRSMFAAALDALRRRGGPE